MDLFVNRAPGCNSRGLLTAGGNVYPCALGRGGCVSVKREGDGGTPRGAWGFRRVYYRPDRVARVRSALPVIPLKPSDGWCDWPGDANYNRFVKLPYSARSENLWRDDELYDVIAVLGHNDVPRIQGGGSAIFMHIAKPGYPATEGCIALQYSHLINILANVRTDSRVHVLTRI